jgi:hypothetical protein
MFDGKPLTGWRDIMVELRPKIEKALHHGYDTYSFDNLVLAVERSRLKLFYRSDAVVFCEISLFPQYKVLNLVLCAGDMDGVLLLEEAARQWGKAMECKKVWFTGRPGWARLARQRGWKKSSQPLFWMELTDG